MNRSVTFVGVFVLILGLGLFALPEAMYGQFELDWATELAIVAVPAALMIILWGASLPNPSRTTVGGVFGSPEENLVRRRSSSDPTRSASRFVVSSTEPVNCRRCYTLVPATLAECPRCGTRRLCRGCSKPLFYLSGAVRCGPCVRDETFCDCPKVSPKPEVGLGSNRMRAP